MESYKKQLRTKIYLYPAVLLILLNFIFISSCSAPKIALYSEVIEMPTETLESGRKHFNEYCATCHPGGMSGLGPAIINKHLPEFLIKFQIRNGVGVMLAFDDRILSDKQVENIAEYLVYLRKK